jgi:hypothetical protein
MTIKDELSVTCEKAGSAIDSKGEPVKLDELTTFGLHMKLKKIESYQNEVMKVLDKLRADVDKLMG